MRRFVVALVLPLPVGAIVLALQPAWMIDAFARAYPSIVWKVATADPLVALTFDDGPDPVNTPLVLDVLARHGAKATFFLIGGNARRFPSIVDRIRGEGHAIGNHTHGDTRTIDQPLAEFQASVLEAERILALDTSPRFFRPASGFIRDEQRAWIESRGYRCVLGSAYPYDPAQPPVAYMVWLVRKNLEPGAIVVMHDKGERARSIAALPGILEAGREKGLRFVTLPDLWARRKS